MNANLPNSALMPACLPGTEMLRFTKRMGSTRGPDALTIRSLQILYTDPSIGGAARKHTRGGSNQWSKVANFELLARL